MGVPPPGVSLVPRDLLKLQFSQVLMPFLEPPITALLVQQPGDSLVPRDLLNLKLILDFFTTHMSTLCLWSNLLYMPFQPVKERVELPTLTMLLLQWEQPNGAFNKLMRKMETEIQDKQMIHSRHLLTTDSLFML